MSYKGVELLNIFFNQSDSPIPLGRLGFKNRKLYFEYHESFIHRNIHVSPFKLPLKAGIQTCDDPVFYGLFGLFNDSLPDGWGRLLLDRQVEKYGINRGQLTPLDRLAHVGQFGMGALSYEPTVSHYKPSSGDIQLDKVAKESLIVLEGEHEEVFEELLALNGSSAGARPKIVTGVSHDKQSIIHGLQNLPESFSHWMIKFPASSDPKDISAIEYAYSLMAKAAGIEMSETHLFKTHSKNQYFGIKRFDRKGNQPIHMHSLSGLIHADHRTPNIDYEMVLRVTQALTKNMQEVEKLFRLACFNVLAHNRDDHSKNFSYVMNSRHEWKLAPAYDLTFSFGPNGEQSMLVAGEGKNPNIKNLLQLSKKFSIKYTDEILEQVISAISKWKEYAQKAGVSSNSINEISQYLHTEKHTIREAEKVR